MRARVIHLHDLWLRPIAWRSGPAAWMTLASLFVGLLTDRADRISLIVVTLVRRHVLDAAVAVLSVVPVNKAIDPGPHREKIPEAPVWIALVVFQRPK